MTKDERERLERMRSDYWEQPWHDEVLRLCKLHGYGAVMQSASEQWRKKEPKAALTLGPCFGELENDP